MKTVCIVQARMGSKRLPGKVLLPLNGHTVIGEVLTRCKRIPGVDHVVCAIPTAPGNEPLFSEACRYGDTALVSEGKGENDVLARYAAVARTTDADIIVRITGDCPLICPELCGDVVTARMSASADYASNIEPRTFPQGYDCEVFTNDILQQAHLLSEEREHVTPWIREHAKVIASVRARWKMDGRLTIDTEDDYRVICAAFGHAPYEHLRAA